MIPSCALRSARSPRSRRKCASLPTGCVGSAPSACARSHYMQITKLRKSLSPSRSGNTSPNRRVPALAVGAAVGEKANDSEELFSPNRT